MLFANKKKWMQMLRFLLVIGITITVIGAIILFIQNLIDDEPG